MANGPVSSAIFNQDAPTPLTTALTYQQQDEAKKVAAAAQAQKTKRENVKAWSEWQDLGDDKWGAQFYEHAKGRTTQYRDIVRRLQLAGADPYDPNISASLLSMQDIIKSDSRKSVAIDKSVSEWNKAAKDDPYTIWDDNLDGKIHNYLYDENGQIKPPDQIDLATLEGLYNDPTAFDDMKFGYDLVKTGPEQMTSYLQKNALGDGVNAYTLKSVKSKLFRTYMKDGEEFLYKDSQGNYEAIVTDEWVDYWNTDQDARAWLNMKVAEKYPDMKPNDPQYKEVQKELLLDVLSPFRTMDVTKRVAGTYKDKDDAAAKAKRAASPDSKESVGFFMDAWEQTLAGSDDFLTTNKKVASVETHGTKRRLLDKDDELLQEIDFANPQSAFYQFREWYPDAPSFNVVGPLAPKGAEQIETIRPTTVNIDSWKKGEGLDQLSGAGFKDDVGNFKTIESAKALPQKVPMVGKNEIELTFTDGTKKKINADSEEGQKLLKESIALKEAAEKETPAPPAPPAEPTAAADTTTAPAAEAATFPTLKSLGVSDADSIKMVDQANSYWSKYGSK